jgi:hypothetical protein
VGACAWAKLPVDRQAVLLGYHAGIQSGMSELDACARDTDVPNLWAQVAVGSEVIQEGAAIEIASAAGASRDQLEAAWREAPATSRECFPGQRVEGLWRCARRLPQSEGAALVRSTI